MTLRKQLFLALSAVFLALLMAVLVASVSGTRRYLEQQLASHAQDAATALSHSLVNSLGKADAVLAASQVNSVFDRGYFRQVVVMQLDGKTFYQRVMPADVANVPAWFSRLIPLETASGEAFVSSGWRQLGKVGVVSQPTLAYEHLWKEAVDLVIWLILAYAITLYLTAWLLKVILKPLGEVEQLALAVQSRRFETIKTIPRAPELSRVVRAMNDLSQRVSELLDIEFNRAESLRREAYSDEVTGLDNRRGFDLRLGQTLVEAQFDHGRALSVAIHGLPEFSVRRGYQEGDRLLRVFAQEGRELLGLGRGAICGRIGPHALMFLQFDEPPEQFESACRALRARYLETLEQFAPAPELSFAMGAAAFMLGDQRSQVMSRTDLALEIAREAGRNQWHLLPVEQAGPGDLGSVKWRAQILDALREGRAFVVSQPVLRLASGVAVHVELMARLRDVDGEAISAALFVPMAHRHHLMPQIDGFALQHAVERARRFPGQRYSVNVSVQAIGDAGFLARMNQLLKSEAAIACCLTFELSEFACVEQESLVADFVSQIRALGCGFGIDHFGLDPVGLQFVRRVPPDFVKLDGSLVLDLLDHSEVSVWVQSVITTLQPLSIEVYALFVETPAVRVKLDELGVAAGQGLLYGLPREDDI